MAKTPVSAERHNSSFTGGADVLVKGCKEWFGGGEGGPGLGLGLGMEKDKKEEARRCVCVCVWFNRG